MNILGFAAGVAGGAVFLALCPTDSFLHALGIRLGIGGTASQVLVHLAVSGAAGMLFGWSVGCLAGTAANGVLFGTAYGMILWLLGSAVPTPWQAVGHAGMRLPATPEALSLVLAHIGYGVVTGLVYGVCQQCTHRCAVHRRAREQST